MKAPKQEGKQRALPPEGQHAARCWLVAYIGHQNVVWQGQEKQQPKLVLSYEIPSETHVFKPEIGPEPFAISKTFTYSMDARGNLRKHIEAWRGKPYATDDEAAEVDFKKFCGHPALINVSHEERGGKVYANLTSIMPLPKAMQILPQVNKSVIYDLREDGKKMEHLPEWIQNKIKESREWKNYSAPKDEYDGIPFDEPAPTQGETLKEEDCPF